MERRRNPGVPGSTECQDRKLRKTCSVHACPATLPRAPDGRHDAVPRPAALVAVVALCAPPRDHLLARRFGPTAASGRRIRGCGCRFWVGHCRPRTSAVRSLNLEVSFPAVRSLTLLSLADPSPTLTTRDGSPPSLRSLFGSGQQRRVAPPRRVAPVRRGQPAARSRTARLRNKRGARR